MDVRNCRTCGKLFNYIGGQPICTNCQRKLEEKFQEVKEYLRENPNSSINQVAEENDVSVKQIKQWIREERLTVTNAGADGITCEQCGAPIHTGRFCEKCKAAMVNNLSGAISKPKMPEESKKSDHDNKNRMRFLQG